MAQFKKGDYCKVNRAIMKLGRKAFEQGDDVLIESVEKRRGGTLYVVHSDLLGGRVRLKADDLSPIVEVFRPETKAPAEAAKGTPPSPPEIAPPFQRPSMPPGGAIAAAQRPVPPFTGAGREPPVAVLPGIQAAPGTGPGPLVDAEAQVIIIRRRPRRRAAPRRRAGTTGVFPTLVNPGRASRRAYIIVGILLLGVLGVIVWEVIWANGLTRTPVVDTTPVIPAATVPAADTEQSLAFAREVVQAYKYRDWAKLREMTSAGYRGDDCLFAYIERLYATFIPDPGDYELTPQRDDSRVYVNNPRTSRGYRLYFTENRETPGGFVLDFPGELRESWQSSPGPSPFISAQDLTAYEAGESLLIRLDTAPEAGVVSGQVGRPEYVAGSGTAGYEVFIQAPSDDSIEGVPVVVAFLGAIGAKWGVNFTKVNVYGAGHANHLLVSQDIP